MRGPLILGVNVDHVATLRQARRGREPDPVAAAALAERAGAGGITVHLREDRRHVQDDDVERLRRSVTTKLNLEMAAVEEMVEIALGVRPDEVCLVPERRAELTTEGGLDAAGREQALAEVVRRLERGGIRVSLFVDAEPAQIEAAARIGASMVELHTGTYAGLTEPAPREAELERLRGAAVLAVRRGLQVNAGHGLTADNVAPVAAIPEVVDVNVGHSIVARVVLIGMEGAVREMRTALDRARGVL